MDERDQYKKGSTFTAEELAAIDPVMGADSVMLDKLLRTIHNTHVSARSSHRMFHELVVRLQTVWLAPSVGRRSPASSASMSTAVTRRHDRTL